MGVSTTSSPLGIVVDSTKQIKSQKGYWIKRILYNLSFLKKDCLLVHIQLIFRKILRKQDGVF